MTETNTFDPSKFTPDATTADASKFLQIPGDYIVAFTKYTGRQANVNGKEFLKLSGVVIDGEPKAQVVGKLFTQRAYITKESYGRIGAMCAAMGYADAFDLSDDDAVREAFLRRPFKAKFKTETRDGNVYAGISFFEHRLTTEERDAMNEWVASADLSMEGDAPPPPADEDVPF